VARLRALSSWQNSKGSSFGIITKTGRAVPRDEGSVTKKLRDGEVLVGPGEFVVIPCRVEHMPVAKDEVHVILIEPKTTLNTGNVVDEKTVEQSRKYEISHKGDAQNPSTGR
jgi:hypothetical protein